MVALQRGGNSQNSDSSLRRQVAALLRQHPCQEQDQDECLCFLLSCRVTAALRYDQRGQESHLLPIFVGELDAERNSWMPGFACSLSILGLLCVCVPPSTSVSVTPPRCAGSSPRFLAALHCHRPVGVDSGGKRARRWRDPRRFCFAKNSLKLVCAFLCPPPLGAQDQHQDSLQHCTDTSQWAQVSGASAPVGGGIHKSFALPKTFLGNLSQDAMGHANKTAGLDQLYTKYRSYDHVRVNRCKCPPRG